MKVILKQDVKGTGKKGEILDVSDGYAKNFLLKKGLAEQASSVAVNSLKIQKEAEESRRARGNWLRSRCPRRRPRPPSS